MAERGTERLERVAEDAIVADVLRTGLPLLFGLALLGFIGGVLAFSENPLRVVSPSVAIVVIGVAFVVRRRRPRTAVVLLAGAIAFTALFGMIFNGGLRAPAAALLLALVSLLGWLFGWRGATITAAVCSVIVVLVGLASAEGLLRQTTSAPPVAHAIFFIVFIWLVWTTTAVPFRRLRLALIEAADREDARLDEEKRRLESELAFKRVFDHTAQIVLVTSADGQVLHLNRAASEFLKVTDVASLQRQQVVDLAGWGDAKEPLAACLQRAAPGAASTFELKREQSRFEFTVTRLDDASGAPSGVLLEGRDVTSLVDAEQREARARRLSLVGQLAGGVAHDFNNVLAVVMTSADMLRADLETQGPLRPQVIESLEAISTSAQRASDLTRRLLRFSRQQPLAPKLISMHEFLESAVKLLTRVLPPRITVSTELSAPKDTVMADVASLESALLNLAINARDAMEGPGRLMLSTACIEPDDLWQASGGSSRWTSAFLRVSVRDTGPGIPRELQDKLFEPFITTKVEGTGIGLASVFATMHAHGGTVSVRSDEGRGTDFHLDFPLAEGAVVRGRASGSEKPWFAQRRALVVDDEAALRRMMARLLESVGFTVTVAPDAEKGLATFLQSSDAFDVAVLDVVLPGRPGSELAAELLRRSKWLKVVLASGFPRDADLSGLPDDRVRFLSKPFTSKALYTALEELLPPMEAKVAS